jgi:hypothetical protein
VGVVLADPGDERGGEDTAEQVVGDLDRARESLDELGGRGDRAAIICLSVDVRLVRVGAFALRGALGLVGAVGVLDLVEVEQVGARFELDVGGTESEEEVLAVARASLEVCATIVPSPAKSSALRSAARSPMPRCWVAP